MSSEKAVDYQSAIKAIALCARILTQHNLRQILVDIEYTESVGALFNPTLWIEKNKALSEDKQMVEAAIPLWKLGLFLDKKSEYA